jgi:hypothetical protein
MTPDQHATDDSQASDSLPLCPANQLRNSFLTRRKNLGQ